MSSKFIGGGELLENQKIFIIDNTVYREKTGFSIGLMPARIQDKDNCNRCELANKCHPTPELTFVGNHHNILKETCVGAERKDGLNVFWLKVDAKSFYPEATEGQIELFNEGIRRLKNDDYKDSNHIIEKATRYMLTHTDELVVSGVVYERIFTGKEGCSGCVFLNDESKSCEEGYKLCSSTVRRENRYGSWRVKPNHDVLVESNESNPLFGSW